MRSKREISGDLLGAIMNERGVTPAELASRVGMAKATVWRYVKHGALPSVDVYAKLLDALGYELTVINKRERIFGEDHEEI
jgi:transcriptional regulator with XRE-family HTH domain